MKAKELDTMVKAMRSKYNKVYSRSEITDTIYYLYKGVKAIGKDELAKELLELYMEIDSVDTSELVEIGTFR
jgi:hypothetical protein